MRWTNKKFSAETVSDLIPHKRLTDLLHVGWLMSLGTIRGLPLSFPLFFRLYSSIVTTRQEIAVGVYDHKQFATCFVAVARVQEVLKGNWSLRGADDVDLLFLRATV